MTTREEILLLLERHRDPIKKFGVKEIGVFGSFARGDQKSTSDVDVLVDLAPDHETFRDYMGLLFYLEQLFGRKVDLVMRDTVKPIIRNRVLRETVYATGF